MTQTFYEYMIDFLREKNVRVAIEIGSDVQLKLASRLAPHCTTFYSVNFPLDHARMRGWYEMHCSIHENLDLRLLSGNAL